MSVGIGSKSVLAYVIESVYGTFPTGTPAGTQLGLMSESIQSSRSSFASQEINPTRQMTAVRSGNVAASGDISMEFSPNNLGMLLKHLLCPTSYSATTVTPTALTNSLVVTRGTFYTAGTNTYLCVRSGTADAAASTSGKPVSVDFSEEKNGTAYFQFYAVTSGNPIYQHTFNAGVTKIAGGFSVERQVFLDTGVKYFRYVGGRPNTWALDVPQEGIVKSNFGFIFLDGDDTIASGTSGLGTNVAANDEPFSGAETVIQVKAPGGSYADDFSLSDFKLNVTNNYDDRVYSVGQTRRRDLPEQMRVVTGSFSAYFEDMVKYNYFRGEVALAIMASFNHKGQFATVEVKKCKLTGGSPAPMISGNGVVSAQFNFEAFTDGTNDLTVTLSNNTTTY